MGKEGHFLTFSPLVPRPPSSHLALSCPRSAGSPLPPLHPVAASGGAPGSERAREADRPRGHHEVRQAAGRLVHAEGHQPARGRSALLQAHHRDRQHGGSAHGDVLWEVVYSVDRHTDRIGHGLMPSDLCWIGRQIRRTGIDYLQLLYSGDLQGL